MSMERGFPHLYNLTFLLNLFLSFFTNPEGWFLADTGEGGDSPKIEDRRAINRRGDWETWGLKD